MKLTDMIISAMMKKGILFEARNVDTTVEIPVRTQDDSGSPLDVLKLVTVRVTAEHVSVRIDKDEKEKA